MFVKKPPMGFNTWNTFGEKINEDLIMETADAMVHEGLLDAGYEYLVIDDCWSEYDRDPKTHQLVPHHEKFPHGIKYVADYVHAKGLKFGIYSCAGVRTCADYPGSYDHEYLERIAGRKTPYGPPADQMAEGFGACFVRIPGRTGQSQPLPHRTYPGRHVVPLVGFGV